METYELKSPEHNPLRAFFTGVFSVVSMVGAMLLGGVMLGLCILGIIIGGVVMLIASLFQKDK